MSNFGKFKYNKITIHNLANLTSINWNILTFVNMVTKYGINIVIIHINN